MSNHVALTYCDWGARATPRGEPAMVGCRVVCDSGVRGGPGAW